MDAPDSRVPSFQAPYAPPDEELARGLLADAAREPAAESRIDARARRLIEAIRARASGLGGIDEFLHAYSLSTKEGLALMVLAEALLRVPDAATADRLIEDKLAAGRWFDGDIKSTALLVSASAWTLGIAARIIHPGETPETILDAIVKRLGLPITATSANLFGLPECTSASGVREQLGGKIPLIVDGGPTTRSMATTIVDLSGGGNSWMILREGAIPTHEIALTLQH